MKILGVKYPLKTLKTILRQKTSVFSKEIAGLLPSSSLIEQLLNHFHLLRQISRWKLFERP